jgi:hypothetical protein
MKMFLILIAISSLIAWLIIALSGSGPDKPSLITNKTKINGNKYMYVAFKANKKSPWRRIYFPYEKKAPCKMRLLDYALSEMEDFDIEGLGMTAEEANLMYSTIKEEYDKYYNP